MVTGLGESVVDGYSSQFTAEGEAEFCTPMLEAHQDKATN